MPGIELNGNTQAGERRLCRLFVSKGGRDRTEQEGLAT
jgi:hypothetical protein